MIKHVAVSLTSSFRQHEGGLPSMSDFPSEKRNAAGDSDLYRGRSQAVLVGQGKMQSFGWRVWAKKV